MRKVSKKQIKSFIINDICEIPILYSCPNIAFSICENWKNRHCVPSWYDCREIFHADYPKANHIFINHRKGSYNKIKGFLESVEKKLNLKNKSKCYKTVKKTCTLIVLSYFWYNEIKFSLLTLLLRVCCYNKINEYCSKIFHHCKYLNSTRRAVKVFMEGRVDYKGEMFSWYEQFKHLSIKESKYFLR